MPKPSKINTFLKIIRKKFMRSHLSVTIVKKVSRPCRIYLSIKRKVQLAMEVPFHVTYVTKHSEIRQNWLDTRKKFMEKNLNVIFVRKVTRLS